MFDAANGPSAIMVAMKHKRALQTCDTMKCILPRSHFEFTLHDIKERVT